MGGYMLWGKCKYCKTEGPLTVSYFSFPIDCECCDSAHVERIEHCNRCNVVMPKTAFILIATTKLQDPIHEGLFKKEAFI